MEKQEALPKYKTHFFNEFKKCVKELTREEQIHFADIMMQIAVFAYQDPADPHIFEVRERELLAKYCYKMKYFVLSDFISFLLRTEAHFEKTCLQLEINPGELRADFENGNIFIELTALLDSIKTFLYISDTKGKGDTDKTELEADILVGKGTPGLVRKNGITTPRQVLTLYYLFKAMGIKLRHDVTLSVMAKFLHLLLGWDYPDINNSTLYKLLKQAPKVKENKQSLKADLHWVKEQFEKINFELPAKMIEEELKGLI